jgi:hypothetical protein
MNLGFEIKQSRLLKKAGNVTRQPQTRQDASLSDQGRREFGPGAYGWYMRVHATRDAARERVRLGAPGVGWVE